MGRACSPRSLLPSGPGALPQAGMGRAIGAQDTEFRYTLLGTDLAVQARQSFRKLPMRRRVFSRQVRFREAPSCFAKNYTLLIGGIQPVNL